MDLDRTKIIRTTYNGDKKRGHNMLFRFIVFCDLDLIGPETFSRIQIRPGKNNFGFGNSRSEKTMK
jgi:hypothetical protein